MNGKNHTMVLLSIFIAVLAASASLAGLLLPGLYRDSAYMLPQAYGQDLVTLFIGVPLLVVSSYYLYRGSYRGKLVWLGTVFYFLYTYSSYCFLTVYNQLFLLYVGLFSGSLFAFSGGLMSLDVRSIRALLSEKTPSRATAIYLIILGLLVAVMWLGQIVPALVKGEMPEVLMLSGTSTLVIQALDLGVLVSMFIIAGIWMWEDKTWGYALAGILLIKATTLGAAVLSMIYFMKRAGLPVAWPQVMFFVVFTAAAAVLSVVYIKNLKESID